jgi:hypothetical protein
MKVVFTARRRESGSVLIGSLIIALILGVTLISYLSLTSNQYRSIFRSQTWATSLALSEAGVEEGLALINKYVGTGLPITNWPNTAAADGWTPVGANAFFKTGTLGNQFGTYSVYVTNNGDTPTIYTEGYAVWNSAAAPSGALLATLGVANSTAQANQKTVDRKVFVQTRRSSLFPVPMTALGPIDLMGNNIRTDSFDSADPAYNTGGKYDPAKAKANGTVITTSTLINSLNVGNAKIKGMVKTGPNGSISIGANGSVGDSAWVDSGKQGIQPGYSANDVNLQFPDAELPSLVSWNFGAPGGLTLAQRTIGGVTYDQVYLTSGSYEVGSLGGKIYIATNAQVNIHVTGNVSMGGGEYITIAPHNASLAIYMSGSTFKVTGNSAINNMSEKAENFAYFGLPSNTTVQFGGNGSFVGTVYAPQANFLLGGGGADEYDFVGASVTKTVKMNGKFRFHYDENLARVGPGRGYVPTLWAEQ